MDQEPRSVDDIERAVLAFGAEMPRAGIEASIVSEGAVAVWGDSSIEERFRDRFADEIASGTVVFQALDRSLRAVSSADGVATLITAPLIDGADAEAHGVLATNAEGCVVVEYQDGSYDLVIFGHGTSFRKDEGQLEIVAVGPGRRSSGTQVLGDVPTFGGGHSTWTERVLGEVTGQSGASGMSGVA